MRIGELARQAGVSTRTLRHYEALGLVTARRAANGYRDYGGAELRAVAEIRSLADLGFTLEETRPFVECLRAGNAVSGSCPDSIAVYRRKLSDIDGYLTRLSRVRAELQAQLAQALAARASSAGDPRCEFSRPGLLPSR
jgi:DNA-binding transcriptional MerR regulator